MEIRKRFGISVLTPNSTITKTFELGTDIKVVNGILLTSDKEDLLYYRGSQKIKINQEEYFPDDYESKLLMSGISVPPNNRYYKLGVELIEPIIEITYTDKDEKNTVFSPYRVSLYITGLYNSKI